MTAQPALDFGHTPHAENNRQKKAHALAGAAKALGLRPFELARIGGRPGVEERRARVRRLARVQAASEESWALALGQLEGMERWICGTDECPKCGWPVKVVRSERGKALMLDPFAHELGTVLPVAGVDGVPRARVIAASAPRPDGEPLFRQHAVSCPGAASVAVQEPQTSPAAAPAGASVCASCGGPLDAVLASRDPTYTTHPTCPEGGTR